MSIYDCIVCDKDLEDKVYSDQIIAVYEKEGYCTSCCTKGCVDDMHHCDVCGEYSNGSDCYNPNCGK